MIFCINGCTNKEQIKYCFTLTDKNYNTVAIGTDIIGKWNVYPMEKKGNEWIKVFYKRKGMIQYKFLINGDIWMRDPKNKKKIKVPAPFAGYNSIVEDM